MLIGTLLYNIRLISDVKLCAAPIVAIYQQTMILHNGLLLDFSAWEAAAQLPPTQQRAGGGRQRV